MKSPVTKAIVYVCLGTIVAAFAFEIPEIVLLAAWGVLFALVGLWANSGTDFRPRREAFITWAIIATVACYAFKGAFLAAWAFMRKPSTAHAWDFISDRSTLVLLAIYWALACVYTEQANERLNKLLSTNERMLDEMRERESQLTKR